MNRLLILVMALFLFSFAGSPTKTAYEAEKKRMDMYGLKTNMSMDQVKDKMGMPKKVERREMDGIEYEIWYYLTKGVNLDQSRYIDENFTPFIFYGSCLKGWGWNFYNYLFDINNARFKREQESNKRYKEKEGDWPGYSHKIITPNYEDQTEDKHMEKALENLLKEPSQPQIQQPEEPISEPTNTEPVESKKDANSQSFKTTKEESSDTQKQESIQESTENAEIKESKQEKSKPTNAQNYNWW